MDTIEPWNRTLKLARAAARIQRVVATFLFWTMVVAIFQAPQQKNEKAVQDRYGAAEKPLEAQNSARVQISQLI